MKAVREEGVVSGEMSESEYCAMTSTKSSDGEEAVAKVETR